ncbi:SDR family NAD(P)-dependent oxidoreductase [Streptomyces sp. 1222.5]|uniref:SDR family NAD(P)-dependent oxidoreductase n=1 Tax=Streptomyces sp. 1222.5 TaxID=1881026 RepID=UPI003EC0EA4B
MANVTDTPVAIVIGAGSGIGAATAKMLAASGWAVACADINNEAVEEVCQTISKNGGTARSFVLDVRDRRAVARVVETVVDLWGYLYGAVNCAGVISRSRMLLTEIEESEWLRMIDINLTGVFNCLQAELRAMRRTGEGSIVNVASICGLAAQPGAAGYVASKHAVVGLSKAAALEYAAEGIRVNAVCPGFIDTPLLAGQSAERRAEVISMHPLNRLGQAREVSSLIRFLLSVEAAFITGAAYPIDGGYLAK